LSILYNFAIKGISKNIQKIFLTAVYNIARQIILAGDIIFFLKIQTYHKRDIRKSIVPK